MGPVFEPLVSPLIEIEALDVRDRIRDIEVMIFTSENGVESVTSQADLKARTAYCVGDRTASAARAAGMEAISAGGSAEDLKSLIMNHGQRRPMVHIRGEHSRGDVAKYLTEHGFDVRAVVAYRQVEASLSPEAHNVLEGEKAVLLPLFSPRTARIYFDQVGFARAPTHVIAMSSAVASEIDLSAVRQCVVSDAPTSGSMIKALTIVIRDLWSLEGSEMPS
jgi:uroporphyrinogen-III synthase